MRHVTAVLALSALALLGCRGSPPPPPAAGAGGQAGLAKILDSARAATKAKEAGKAQWFTPENLHELIDGQDQYFIAAGFKRLVHTELQAPDTKGDAYTEFDLYDMGSPEGALDVLADSRTEKTTYLPIGSEAQKSDEGIELRVGRFYLRLTARRDVEGQQEFVQSLAQAAAKAAPAGPSDAELVAPLPAEGILPHTAAYTTTGFLGHDFLKEFREAAYEADGRQVRLFAADGGDEAKAQAMAKQWRESVTPPPAAGSEGPESFAYQDPYAGDILVVRQGKWLAGVIGDARAAKPLLDAALKQTGGRP